MCGAVDSLRACRAYNNILCYIPGIGNLSLFCLFWLVLSILLTFTNSQLIISLIFLYFFFLVLFSFIFTLLIISFLPSFKPLLWIYFPHLLLASWDGNLDFDFQLFFPTPVFSFWKILLEHCWYLVAQSCPTLCDPLDCSPPASSVHGILQARILEWAAISSSWGSSWPGDWALVSCTSCIGRGILY